MPARQGLPFCVAGVGDLLALFRCISCRYCFGTNIEKPDLLGAPGRVFTTMEVRARGGAGARAHAPALAAAALAASARGGARSCSQRGVPRARPQLWRRPALAACSAGLRAGQGSDGRLSCRFGLQRSRRLPRPPSRPRRGPRAVPAPRRAHTEAPSLEAGAPWACTALYTPRRRRRAWSLLPSVGRCAEVGGVRRSAEGGGRRGAQPEMSRNVQKYGKEVYHRASEAQQCRVHSTLVIPLFASAARSAAVGALEVVQTCDDMPFASVVQALAAVLEARGPRGPGPRPRRRRARRPSVRADSVRCLGRQNRACRTGRAHAAGAPGGAAGPRRSTPFASVVRPRGEPEQPRAAVRAAATR
jgi:hypothetical protein